MTPWPVATAGDAAAAEDAAAAGDARTAGDAMASGDVAAIGDAARADHAGGLGHKMMLAAGDVIGAALGLCATVGTRPTAVNALTSSAEARLALTIPLLVMALLRFSWSRPQPNEVNIGIAKL
jgi:hypothetical protein